MKLTKKTGALMLALLLALTLSVAALAEEADPAAADTAVTDALAEAQANQDALNAALEAYSSARQDSRKKQMLENLKQELDTYVAAGTLTQEQADLILTYYAEQLALNNSVGIHGGKGVKNKNGSQSDTVNGFGWGGRHGRKTAPQAAPSADSAESNGTGI